MPKKKYVKDGKTSLVIRETLIFSAIIPILCALLTSVFADAILKDLFKWKVPKTYEIRNVSTIDNFKLAEYFPLDKGNYWVYRFKYTIRNSEKDLSLGKLDTVELSDNIKVEVKNTFKKDIYELVILEGDMFDAISTMFEFDNKDKFNQSMKQIKMQEFGLLINSNTIYYSSEKSTLNNMIKFFNDTADSYMEIGSFKPILNLPFFEGQRFGGDSTDILRTDGMYMWNVEKQEGKWYEEFGYIEGDLFELSYRTNPSHQIIRFAPYIGITNWEAIHHGAICEMYLQLIDYKVNDNGPLR